jgi:hypothetical protein
MLGRSLMYFVKFSNALREIAEAVRTTDDADVTDKIKPRLTTMNTKR